MEKTMEQKLASKERYLSQEAKAIEMLRSSSLYDFINGLKYAYSLSIHYRKNLRDFILFECFNPFKEVEKDAKTHLYKCFISGILKPWNNTYWFDKEKAESLQQYILEHTNYTGDNKYV